MHRNVSPFEVGQLVETRSFLSGFRGAWFQCKIKEILYKNGQAWLSLEYCDFPDEKILRTKVYQKPPTSSGRKPREMKRELMVRPSFPHVYRQDQMPDAYPLSDVVVIVRDCWKVGDLVDWLTDGCYWSGRVIDTFGDEKVKIELPPPPLGEGSTYDAFCKDLRPALNWSPDSGWTKLFSTDSALLLKPAYQGISSELAVHVSDDHYFSSTSSCHLTTSPQPEHSAEQPLALSTTAPEEISTSVVPVEGSSSDLAVHVSDDRYFLKSDCPSVSSPPPEHSAEQPLDLSTTAPVEIPTSVVPVEGSSSDLAVHVSDDHYFLKSSCPSASSPPPEHSAEQPLALSTTAPEEIPTSVVLVEGSSSDLAVHVSDDHYLSKSSCPSASSPLPEHSAEQPLALSTIAPEEILTPVVHATIEWRAETGATTGVSGSHSLAPSRVSENSLPPKDRVEQDLSAPGSKVSFKRRKIGEDCIRTESIEAAIVGMEELLNRVQWMKHIFEVGTPSNFARPSWKFVEHR